MNEAAFLVALADPSDDLTRLAYADWLEENGQDGKAAYLRAELRLARMDPADERAEVTWSILNEMRKRISRTWVNQARRPYHAVVRSVDPPWKTRLVDRIRTVLRLSFPDALALASVLPVHLHQAHYWKAVAWRKNFVKPQSAIAGWPGPVSIELWPAPYRTS